MSVSSYLTNLASTLVLSELEKTSIAVSTTTLSSRLDNYFGSKIIQHFRFGSSDRGTILPRKADKNSDIDYMVVFNTFNNPMMPQTYLDYLRSFVTSRYATSEVKQSYPIIILSLNHINFELVPSIYNHNYGYSIPSPASHWNDWMNTNPSETNKLITNSNKANDFQIKPLVRLIKYWNTSKGSPFTSFSLEKHIVNSSFYGCSKLSDYFYTFWLGFNYSYNSSQRTQDIVSAAKEHAKTAKIHEDKNMPIYAEYEIKKKMGMCASATKYA